MLSLYTVVATERQREPSSRGLPGSEPHSLRSLNTVDIFTNARWLEADTVDPTSRDLEPYQR